MKSTIKNICAATTIIFLLTISSCVININEGEDCLRCYYKNDGREVTEELCNPFFTETEKAAMRVRMQATADSLGTVLDCEEH